MKVKIGNYVNWFGPYQLAELCCFWAKEVPDEYGFMRKPDYVHNFGEWLAHGNVKPTPNVGDITSLNGERPCTMLYTFLSWINSGRERKVSVKLDSWDTYSMDSTLAYIILPMLEDLKADGRGAPFVEDVDVPENLKSTSAAPKENDWDTDEHHFARWEYILDEMIFAFGKTNDDSWESEFYSGHPKMSFVKLEDGNSRMISDGDFKVDRVGMKIVQERISNGHLMFGKYYAALWK
jgi:hypothetical protein